MYLLNNGDQSTKSAIVTAHKQGLCRCVHSHGDGRTLTGLALDGVDIDTRGACYSVWEEVWTTPPTLHQALEAAEL